MAAKTEETTSPTSTSPKKEFNFLILGETGVGKSTFINAFMNYLDFNTLDEAIEADKIHALIPAKFTITDDDFNTKTITTVISDANESFQVGQSSTQSVRSYAFVHGDVAVRLIDTPGIGDTRGIEKDEENFDSLLAYMSAFEEIHAIVVMLHPNNSRVTVLFEYCIKQLLASLERSAVDNIVFLFTNSRGTFYKPGDTAMSLRAVLDHIKNTPPNVVVPFGLKNTFCLDNEAFRYLLVKRTDPDFGKDTQALFEESWNVSVRACRRLIAYTANLTPHRIQNSVSVMEARKIVEMLRIPLAQIAEVIQNNIDKAARIQTELRKANLSIEELQKLRFVKRLTLAVKKLDYPMTVCTMTACTERTRIEDGTQIIYKTICHDHCYVPGVGKEVIGDRRLSGCSSMSSYGTCTKCRHSYLQHMHIYYEQEPKEEMQEDKNVVKDINLQESEIDVKEKLLEKYKKMQLEQEEEKIIIQKSVAKFAHFLSNTVILPFNDAYKGYLKYLIQKEKNLGEAANPKTIKNFEALIDQYEDEKAALTKALAEVQKQKATIKTMVGASEVMNIVKELFALKLNGKAIKEMYEAQKKHRNVEATYQRETVVKSKNKGGWETIINVAKYVAGDVIDALSGKKAKKQGKGGAEETRTTKKVVVTAKSQVH